MKPQISELEAQVIFETFERRRKAKTILTEPSTSTLVINTIYFASSGLASYLIADSNIPIFVSSLVVALVGALWSLQRGLNAAVELLRLCEIECASKRK